MAAIDNLGKGDFPKEMAQEYLKGRRKKPMGVLVGEVKERINITPSLESNLAKAVTDRNYLIHHFFIDEYETMALPNGPIILSNRLRPLRDFFVSVHSEVDELTGLVSGELNKPKNEISLIVRMMLKAEWAI